MNVFKTPSQHGFSLLEVLVAFSIMAMSLAMLYRVVGSSARNTGETEQYQRATMLAESLLAQRDAVPDSGWNDVGESAGFTWRIRSAPYVTPISVASPTALPLHEIVIVVEWPGQMLTQAHRIELFTLLPQRKSSNGISLR